MDIQKYANPHTFMRLSGAILPPLVALTAVLMLWGMYLAIWVVPSDFKQGDAARIMLVHVPAASMSIIVYATMAIASLIGLVWRHPVADLVARASAPIGAMFTLLALITGALWGKPTWGAWWVWDARLTSELILFFFYIGYIALWNAMGDDLSKAAQAAAILCLVGSIFAVLAKYSVLFWNTLHQDPSLSMDKERHLHPAFHRPLLLMIFAFWLYYFTLMSAGVRTYIRERRLRMLTQRRAREM